MNKALISTPTRWWIDKGGVWECSCFWLNKHNFRWVNFLFSLLFNNWLFIIIRALRSILRFFFWLLLWSYCRFSCYSLGWLVCSRIVSITWIFTRCWRCSRLKWVLGWCCSGGICGRCSLCLSTCSCSCRGCWIPTCWCRSICIWSSSIRIIWGWGCGSGILRLISCRTRRVVYICLGFFSIFFLQLSWICKSGEWNQKYKKKY